MRVCGGSVEVPEGSGKVPESYQKVPSGFRLGSVEGPSRVPSKYRMKFRHSSVRVPIEFRHLSVGLRYENRVRNSGASPIGFCQFSAAILRGAGSHGCPPNISVQSS